MTEFSVIIPLLNEQEVIPSTYLKLKEIMDGLKSPYELIFINDGSTDRSASIIKEIAGRDAKIKLLSFSRNFGQEAAFSAGLEFASGRAVIFIDADLQDPPEVIPKMIEKWKQGYEIVYGRRLKREGESFFKRWSSDLFYRFLKRMSDHDIPVDVGYFRLIDRKVCEVIKGLREKSRFLRGLISWTGFRQASVDYVRVKRKAGDTKYPLGRMIELSLAAVTSFSYKPLRIATWLGFILSIMSFIYLLVVLFEKIFTSSTVSGWTSIIAINLFFNGVVLIILGIIGEYIGRIYEEAKDRPLYIIADKTGFN